MYFDPGTGSMLIQIFIGAIPVIGAFFIGRGKKMSKEKDNENSKTGMDAKENGVNTEIMADDGFEDIEDD